VFGWWALIKRKASPLVVLAALMADELLPFLFSSGASGSAY